MKKMTKVVALFCLTLGISSCGVVSHTAVVTNNPVGTKTGIAKGNVLQKDMDVTYKKAKENGGITKVGIAESKVSLFIIPFFETKVSGN